MEAAAPPVLRADAARNRRRLLDAASTVFADQGLDAGVEEVARVAGVGMGTLYRRFPTKDALIAELVRELIADLVALAQDCRDDPGGAGLVRLLHGTGEIQASRRGCLARVWNDAQTTALKAEFRTLVDDLVDDARTHGVIRPDITSGDIDLVFLSLRGVIDASKPRGVDAWRRHLALLVASLTPGDGPLSVPALTAAEVTRLRSPLPPH